MSYHRGMRAPVVPLVMLLALARGLVAGAIGGEELPAFARLKRLAGAWYGEEEGGSPVWIRYRVVANGACVLEELRMGDTPSMTSLYYPDGDQLMLTHYCLANSHPRLRTRSIPPDLGELDFVYLDAANVLNSSGGMMDGVRMRLVDEDHFEVVWGASPISEPSVPVRFRRIPEEELRLGSQPPVRPGRSRAEKALARLAGYQGEWIGQAEGFQVAWKLERISGGYALMETFELAPGKDMVSVYHVDGDQLMMTHYCVTKTQPRMRTTAIPADPSRFDLEAMDATNVVIGTDSYMRSLRWEVLGPDRFRQVWNQAVDGLDPIDIDYRRRPTPAGGEAGSER